eukprot:1644424-Rhodomonas_salina.1
MLTALAPAVHICGGTPMDGWEDVDNSGSQTLQAQGEMMLTAGADEGSLMEANLKIWISSDKKRI